MRVVFSEIRPSGLACLAIFATFVAALKTSSFIAATFCRSFPIAASNAMVPTQRPAKPACGSINPMQQRPVGFGSDGDCAGQTAESALVESELYLRMRTK